MDAKAEKNLHRLERKAILEAEKRKKPGECMKVLQIKYHLCQNLYKNENHIFCSIFKR